MTRRGLALALLAIVIPVLVAGCGEDATSPTHKDEGHAQEQNSNDDLPELVIQAEHSDAGRVFRQLFESRTPTSELMADWPEDGIAEAVELVDRLRSAILRQQNRGWMSAPEDGLWWAEDRGCLPEALAWRRGMRVGVTVLALTEETAEAFGAIKDLAPLAEPVEDVLRVAAEEGCARATYNPITLRAGETARLTAGWTRARRFARRVGDQITDAGATDAYVGFRIAVTARGEEGKEPWDLAVRASLSQLETQTDYEVSAEDRLGSKVDGDETEEPASIAQPNRTLTIGTRPQSNTVHVTGEKQCWIMSVRVHRRDEPNQILICAQLVDLE